MYERVTRVVVCLFIAASLVVVSVGNLVAPPHIYIVLAGGLLLVVAAQDLVPTPVLGRLRSLVEVLALLLFVSVLLVLTGGATSPLWIGYLLLVAGSAWWGRPRTPLLLAAGSGVAYAIAALAWPAGLVGTIAVGAPMRVGLGIAALLLVACIASTLSWQRRRAGRHSARPAGTARNTTPPAAPPPTLEVVEALAASTAPVAPLELAADGPGSGGDVGGGRAPREFDRLVATVSRAAVRLPGPTLVKPAPVNTLDVSVTGLLRQMPEMSAIRTVSRPQGVVLVTLAALFAVGLLLAPVAMVVSLNGVITVVYLLALAYNIAIFRAMLRRRRMVTVSDDDALAVPDDELPTYTVMVAAYHEGEIINRTIRALEKLDYPRDRLDILVLLEADDLETVRAARAARPAGHIRIVVVPHALPKTKPKACNYGLQLSSGELVTIYDAEDRPDPLQLRRAAVAFSTLPPQVACLQARLEFHNERQNVLTRWFSAEYVTWFAAVLPALVRLNAPVPLGGTSMHVRRDVLEAVGAWDPFNVTEDADLGIRLRRFGYLTEVLDSVTLEEANSDFINWVKQRSRWYKGYLQTWLVHMRQPRRLWREIGPAGFLGFHVLIGSTPLLALLNPLFWLLTALWFLSGAHIVQVLFPAFIFYPALVSVVLGNFLALYRTMVSVRLADHPRLVMSAVLLPIYWVFMSIAAMRAFVQLVVAPSYWEKTMHGLDGSAEPSSQ